MGGRAVREIEGKERKEEEGGDDDEGKMIGTRTRGGVEGVGWKEAEK